MTEFVTLARFTPEGQSTVQDIGQQYQTFQSTLQQSNCRITKAYAVLGDHDLAMTIEAPDANTLAAALVNASQEWGLKTKTYPVIPINEFIGTLQSTLKTPVGAGSSSSRR